MPLFRYIAGQLGHPTGWFGRTVMARMLNRGNAELIDATLGQLGIEPGDRFLDVGFGGGLALERAADRVGSGTLTGIDPSADMVERASTRFRALVDAGQLELRCAGVEDLAGSADTYDKILTTNTVYFWPRLEPAFEALHGVLAEGGTMCVGFSGLEKMREFHRISRHGFNLHDEHVVKDVATAAGFVDVELLPQHGRFITGDFVLRARQRHR